jgi:hypothetical protein
VAPPRQIRGDLLGVQFRTAAFRVTGVPPVEDGDPRALGTALRTALRTGTVATA